MTAKQKAARAKFKAIQTEAKKLRSKNPKLTQAEAVKQAWAISYNKKSGSVKGYEKTVRKGSKTSVVYSNTAAKKTVKKKAAKKSTKVTQGRLFGNKDRWSNYVKYKNYIITKLFPSGMYEIYDNKAARFVKFDSLTNAKSYINQISKKISGTHKDTKSHNVNIRVVSGVENDKLIRKLSSKFLKLSGYTQLSKDVLKDYIPITNVIKAVDLAVKEKVSKVRSGNYSKQLKDKTEKVDKMWQVYKQTFIK